MELIHRLLSRETAGSFFILVTDAERERGRQSGQNQSKVLIIDSGTSARDFNERMRSSR